MGNLQVRFLEGWAPAMAPGYSTIFVLKPTSPVTLLGTLVGNVLSPPDRKFQRRSRGSRAAEMASSAGLQLDSYSRRFGKYRSKKSA